jgi:hypothetical protein
MQGQLSLPLGAPQQLLSRGAGADHAAPKTKHGRWGGVREKIERFAHYTAPPHLILLTFSKHSREVLQLVRESPTKSARNRFQSEGNLAVIDPHLTDREALCLAIKITFRHLERRREFEALVRERGREHAAFICAYDVQSRSLRLPMWESPPCVASVRGKDRASRLLRRMLKRGISRYHPRPLEAIEAAGTKRTTTPVFFLRRTSRRRSRITPEHPDLPPAA